MPQNKKTPIQVNSQPIVQSDELRTLINEATFTGHPELVYQAEQDLRDGKSESAVAATLTEGLKPPEPEPEPEPPTPNPEPYLLDEGGTPVLDEEGNPVPNPELA